MSSQKQDLDKYTLSRKDFLFSALITVGICTFPLWIAMVCWNTAKFPPQVFGTNEDHFRAHIISPIPQSVEILNVEFDDIIIHPDVTYYFRFYVDRNDLEKIVSSRKLSLDEGACSGSSYPPEWWDVEKLENIERYVYEEGLYGGLLITLCYYPPNKTAYYMYLTY
ncbi:MAG: hypothetical protein J0M11_12775 [Anaerolineae bacterium]|nr:hypothetical protein [Anaerolineae bacterium]